MRVFIRKLRDELKCEKCDKKRCGEINAENGKSGEGGVEGGDEDVVEQAHNHALRLRLVRRAGEKRRLFMFGHYLKIAKNFIKKLRNLS